MEDFIFIPGDGPASDSGPLARFLPPVPEGVVRAFLAQHLALSETKPSAWVLDPFGASPRLAVEAARSGYRLLIAVNNPVTRFLLEMAAAPPDRSELMAALAELAAARKGEERLETHLQSLYLTECVRCRRAVVAEAFVWERGGKTPAGRIYHCPCGEGGEFPATEADQARAAQIGATAALHRSRALERVTALNDPDRPHVEEALDCYLPRPVYALLTVINKLDSLPLTAERRRCLQALVLTACDETNTLWPHPEERPRPKQLTIPPRFLERNVWLALERGVEMWAGSAPPVPVANWPEALSRGDSRGIPPESGGIYLFEGAVRDLAPRLKEIPFQAVVTAIPRPNQAFWTLSALWAGWLWGRQAVGPFKSVLHRRRYDWAWHAGALLAAFKHLADPFPLNGHFFALVAEPEPAYLTAALLASETAKFDLRGLALRTVHDPVQLLWQRRSYEHAPANLPTAEVIRQALQEYLAERGEPAAYLHLHAAALAALAMEQALNLERGEFSQIQTSIQEALGAPDFVHYGGTQNIETGLWGLKEWEAGITPLPDRVEMTVARFLQENSAVTFRELESALCAGMPGLLTPSLGLLRDVLASYAIESGGSWTLRPQDSAAARRTDLDSAARILSTIGQQLGFTIIVENDAFRLLRWEEGGKTVYAFYILASAIIGTILRTNPHPPERSLLVLPGGRAGLLACKLDRDPSLAHIWAGGWRVLKFRALRSLAAIPNLRRDRLESEFSGDPVEAPEQMKLF